eukprot:4110720-Pyramimonas_sp.AAC.1
MFTLHRERTSARVTCGAFASGFVQFQQFRCDLSSFEGERSLCAASMLGLLRVPTKNTDDPIMETSSKAIEGYAIHI